MRLFAAIAFALLAATAGVATHLGAGGRIDLSMIPGLEDVALEFGWIEERGLDADGNRPLSPETRAADAGGTATDGQSGTDGATGSAIDPLAPLPEQAPPPSTEDALNALETAAGTDDPQIAQTSASGTILNVPGRAQAAGPGADGTPPAFAFPLACETGVDCLVSSHVDMSAGEGYSDYTCGALSYNEHKGTDIRLPSHVEMMRGYSVVAAAPGRVAVVRDGMPDANFNLFGREKVTDRGLGNVVVVDHGDGWRTFYGHLRQGSLRVAEGDEVAAGEVVGLVGLSGLTEFPHVHFAVTKDGQTIDPFTGLGLEGGCGIEGTSLWTAAAREALAYPRTLLLRLGFSDQILNTPAVEYMLFKSDFIPAANRAIILHAYLNGLQQGDRIEVRIFGPDGAVFAQAGLDIEEARQIRILRVGRKDLDVPPATGTYEGELRYFRQAETGPQLLFETSETVEVR